MTGDPPDGCISLDLRALDVVVTVEVAGKHAAELAGAIRRSWSRCLVDEAPKADATIRVVHDDDPAVVDRARRAGALAATTRAEVMDRLSPRVTVAAIEQQAGQMVMLHACGLADVESGRTVALVASSGTGKTTASGLLARDLGYVTDETVAVRQDGTIAAYPKPLSVTAAAGGFKHQVDPDELALARAPATCTLAGLAVLARDGSAEAWLEPVPTVRALAVLAVESSYLAQLPRPLHRLADLIDQSGGLQVVHYAEAAQLPPLVARLMSA